MKTYLCLVVLGALVAAGCDDTNKRKRHRNDGGEGGEAGAADAGTGLSPGAGSAGRSNPGAGTAGSTSPTGAGGSGNQGSAGTPGTGGSEADGGAPPASGGSTAAEGGTTPSSGGSGAESGSGANGGSSSGTAPNGGTGATDPCGCAASQACDETETCVERTAIDDFVSCDDAIPQIEGRSGTWGDFGSAAITYTTGFGDPGSAFLEHGCAAWMTGGGELVSTSDYAGLFVMLDDTSGVEGGGPYSLSGHTGIRIAIESVHQLVLQARTVGDGYFGIVLTPDGNPITTYDIPYTYMTALDHSALFTFDLTQVTQIQVTVPPNALASFSFAVHYVGVY